MIVVKVGGKLFELGDLASRLSAWLDSIADSKILLVPGGGRLAQEVRRMDRQHRLGEEASHWLALRTLTLNADFLTRLVPRTVLVKDLEGCPAVWSSGEKAVLDPYRFALADEGRLGSLPHSWDVTSDAVAARVAQVGRARELILLKSVTFPETLNWEELAKLGLVDGYFAKMLRNGLEGWACAVRVLNFREWNTSGQVGALTPHQSVHCATPADTRPHGRQTSRG